MMIRKMARCTSMLAAALALWATQPATAAVVDLTPGPGSSGVINGAIFSFDEIQPSGTGVFQPFVRIQANGTEQGYNTSGSPLPFDEKNPVNFTHDVQLIDLGVVTVSGAEYFLFRLDVNETNGGGHEYLSLDALKIYTSPIGSQTTTDIDSLGVLRYDMGPGSVLLMDYSHSSGSGSSDMSVLVPLSFFAGADPNDFMYFYSAFGGLGMVDGRNYSSSDGFEEWSYNREGGVIPEPASLTLIGLGLLAIFRRPRRETPAV